MTTPQPFMGLPDLGGIVDQVTKILPPQVQDAIKGTVGKVLDPSDPSIHIGDPHAPDRRIPVHAGSEEISGSVKAIDAALGALNLLSKLNFLIPDKYEEWITKLHGALTTIR